jgi:hypothetical protein
VIRSLIRLVVGCALGATLLVSAPATARAGTYTVTACQIDWVNNSWAGHRSNEHVEAFTSCFGEGLSARNAGGYLNAPASRGMVYFDAPSGARILRISGEAKQHSTGGWLAGIRDEGLGRWLWCGPGCLSTFGTWAGFDIGNLSTGRVAAVVECSWSCKRENAVQGLIAIRNVSVVVYDDNPPSVGVAGGSAVSGGWKRGVQSLDVAASDAVGVKRVEVFLDGTRVWRAPYVCNYSLPSPCPNGVDTLELNTSWVQDGRRDLTVRATDAADNVAETRREITIDNTAPLAPHDLQSDAGEGWRSHNRFDVAWDNPPQHGMSPIVGADYRICPAANNPASDTGCVRGARTAPGLRAMTLEAPGPGSWIAHVWLRDAAGNADERTAREVRLRFDGEPPTLSFVAQDDAAPTRLRVAATDTVSGLAEGTIEARRKGESVWRPLPTIISHPGLLATIDDEALPSGVYELRARAVDRAGNERTTTRTGAGATASITLPVRISSRLAVGKVKLVRAKGPRGKRRRILVVRPRARYGRTIPLYGRLTAPGGNPLAERDVDVFERTDQPLADWRRIASVRTTRTGSFVFKALRGPSRTLRFRYPGTETVRGFTSDVELRVRAASSMRVSRQSVVNGEEVTFRGRLRGRQYLLGSKLVQLQAYARGGWLTFATPRADPRTGLWSFRYRFAATRGKVRYRFRVRVPKEPSFPFDSGTSRHVVVNVTGL